MRETYHSFFWATVEGFNSRLSVHLSVWWLCSQRFPPDKGRAVEPPETQLPRPSEPPTTDLVGTRKLPPDSHHIRLFQINPKGSSKPPGETKYLLFHGNHWLTTSNHVSLTKPRIQLDCKDQVLGIGLGASYP